MEKRYLINNQIRAEKVRVIDKEGKQLGVFPLEEALKMAKESGLDLVQITDKVEPPICKIVDYGKFLYEMKKKEKKIKGRQIEMKTIRLSFNISLHDLQTKGNQAIKFLKEGHPLMIEMILRGREKLFENVAKEKFEKFLEIVKQNLEIKVDEPLKKVPKGFITRISKK